MSRTRSANPIPRYLLAAQELRGNPGQWAAYESTGNCVMLAGPGSGKTKTITLKIARLLNEEIRPPHGLACITYSNECVRELKQRLEVLGVGDSRRVFIGTVHGFCLKHLIAPFAKLAGLDLGDPLVVADSKKRDEIFARAAEEVIPHENPAYLWSPVNAYRRTYLDRTGDEFRNRDPKFAQLIERYEELLHDALYVDFDDMVLLGLRLLREHEWVQRAVKARFPVLVVDEYQDLGNPLHQIVLELYSKAEVRLIAVGDPDQSIYGFTGANPALLHELAARDDVETLELKMNYRSGRTIVASSLVALDEQREYVAVGDYEGTITHWKCPTGIEEQVKLVCETIIPEALERREGRTKGDIAVLYIDKKDGAVITRALRDRGIDYVGGDKEARYTTTPLTRWVEDCAAWCSGGWESAKPSLRSLIDFWMNFNEAPLDKETRRRLRIELVRFLWSNRNPAASLKDWLEGLAATGVTEILAQNHVRLDDRTSFDELMKAANDPDKLLDLNVGGFGKLRGSSDHVNLVTLHSSKGLEFDVVIMIGLEQGRIPNYSATTPESKREPRRLFYVGLTRARNEVHLLSSGFYENNYGRRFEYGPSEFVLEVMSKLDAQ